LHAKSALLHDLWRNLEGFVNGKAAVQQGMGVYHCRCPQHSECVRLDAGMEFLRLPTESTFDLSLGRENERARPELVMREPALGGLQEREGEGLRVLWFSLTASCTNASKSKAAMCSGEKDSSMRLIVAPPRKRGRLLVGAAMMPHVRLDWHPPSLKRDASLRVRVLRLHDQIVLIYSSSTLRSEVLRLLSIHVRASPHPTLQSQRGTQCL
jgi:hypothetical protein